ncbi:MAG: hypothetical protein R2806_16475 [Saprospiraceae bacterium]
MDEDPGREDGWERRPGIRLLIRWFFGFIELLFHPGILAFIVIKVTNPHQRIGDLVAGTTCISIRPITTSPCSKFWTCTQPKIMCRFIQASRFSEEQMLVLKQALDRWSKYPNAAYQQLITQLHADVHRQLGMVEILVHLPKVEFLRQVLSDYIVVTRS